MSQCWRVALLGDTCMLLLRLETIARAPRARELPAEDD